MSPCLAILLFSFLFPNLAENNPSARFASNAFFLSIDRIDAARFPEVASYVTVLDDSNTSVKGLTEEHFAVYENGVRQLPITVESLSGDSDGVSITLVIDVSGSMRDELDDARQASVAFVRLMNKFDQAALIIFDRKTTIVQGFTRDKNVVIDAINNIQLGSGTAIYDAALEAINLTNTVEGKKAIIFLSDGRDGNSDADLEDVVAVTPTLGYPIYTIGLGLRGGKGTDELRAIAESSGGAFYETPNSNDLEEIYRSLAFLLIRQSYKITYTSNPCVLDGTTRQVRIEVQNQGMTGSATGNYQAPGHETEITLSTSPQPAPGAEFRLNLDVASAGDGLPEMASLELEISFDSRFINVSKPEAAHILAGAMWGGASAHDLQFAVDENAGILSLSLQTTDGAAPISGKGNVLQIDFSAALEIPDQQDLIFTAKVVSALAPNGCELPLKIAPLTVQSRGLVVWPGDTNTNGVVDLTDVLPLGVYWEISGSPRPGAEDQLAWAPHVATAFTPKTATFADADGNGLVTERDLIPIALNWGLSVTSAQTVKASPRSHETDSLPEGRLLASISEGVEPNQQILTLWLDGVRTETAPGGIMLRLQYPAPARLVNFEHGEIWPGAPLRHVTITREKNCVAAGFMLPKRKTVKVPGGEFLKLTFESTVSIDPSLIVFSEVALIGAAGNIREMEVHFAETEQSGSRKAFQLFPAYPNPFNPVTRIQYFLASTSDLEIKIFDVRGKIVAEIARQAASPGYHLFVWDGKDSRGNFAGSGTYFVRLNGVSREGEAFAANQKILLLK